MYLYSIIRKDKSIPDILYFSHSVIPGMLYTQFLYDAVQFLIEHPDETVVTQLRWESRPTELTDQDLADYPNTALVASNG